MRSKPYKRTKKANAKYYIDYYDLSSGTKKRVTRSTGTADYQTACSILKVKQSEAARAKFEVVTAGSQRFMVEQSRPLADHVQEYMQHIAANDSGDHYLQVLQSSLMRFAAHCKRNHWKEVTDEDAAKFLQHLRMAGLSGGTIHNYRRAIKSLSRWMYETKRSPSDQLLSFKNKINKKRVIRRGVLTRDQFAKLFKSCSRQWRRTNSDDRKIAYCLATRCGLRAGEITQLSEASFCLTGNHPFVLLREDQTKNKKNAKLFLGKKLAAQVEKYYAEGNTLRSLPHKHNLQKMLRHDLKIAGLKQDLGNGERIDFHALRHTCGHWLVSEGVNIKTVQSIMRHSSITMTLDTYGHVLKGAEEDAIAETENLLPI